MNVFYAVLLLVGVTLPLSARRARDVEIRVAGQPGNGLR